MTPSSLKRSKNKCTVAQVFHILNKDAAEHFRVSGSYAPKSLLEDGFIHLSYAQQVCRVADFLYRGREDLVLLELEEAELDGLVLEANPGSSELFPHLYTALRLQQVKRVYPFPCDKTGRFTLPNLGWA